MPKSVAIKMVWYVFAAMCPSVLNRWRLLGEGEVKGEEEGEEEGNNEDEEMGEKTDNGVAFS